MPKLKLQPNPTFRLKVEIPVPGPAVDAVEFTFRHRTKTELEAFVKESADRDDVTTILEMCTGWDLSDAWTRESVAQLDESYMGAGKAIFDKYLSELTKSTTAPSAREVS